MKRRMIGAALALLVTLMTGGVAYAEECSDNNFDAVVLQLGNILGSKTACGLEYDENAIQEFMIKQVEGPMHECIDERKYTTFALAVDEDASVMKKQAEEMPKSHLAAHCIQIRRVAKQYGFIK
jgi:hypothetical protein